MRVFRYGGVNVTFFVPASMHRLNPGLDEISADRLSFPSVSRFVENLQENIQGKLFGQKVREKSVGRFFDTFHSRLDETRRKNSCGNSREKQNQRKFR